jgi:hypothetical protein
VDSSKCIFSIYAFKISSLTLISFHLHTVWVCINFYRLHFRENSATCELIQEAFQTPEALVEKYDSDPDAFVSEIRASLNASLSPLLQLYRCGNEDAFYESGIFEEIESGNDTQTFERNNQMAAKINETLTARTPGEKMVFAVGLAHWLFGSENMISLLEDYGYSMELIPAWNGTQAENPSDEFCGVVFDNEMGIFVDENTFNATSVPSPAPNDMTIVPTPGFEVEDTSLALETSSPLSAPGAMATDATVMPPSSSEGTEETSGPTAMPSQAAAKEVAPEPTVTSGSAAIEVLNVMFALGCIFLFW